MEESSIALCSNVVRRYATHREKTRSAGYSLLFQVLEPVEPEPRVFVAALEISESKETNLQKLDVSGVRISIVMNSELTVRTVSIWRDLAFPCLPSSLTR